MSRKLGVRMVNVLPLPLLILAAALHVGDEGVEGDRIVASGFEVEGRAEFEAVVLGVTAAVVVVVIVVGLVLRGVGDEEEDEDPYGDVEYHRSFAHAE